MNDLPTPKAPGHFRLQFLGAYATVTGSRYLIEAGEARLHRSQFGPAINSYTGVLAALAR